MPVKDRVSYLDIEILKSQHPVIRKLKRDNANHALHGNKVWNSSLVAIDFIHRLEIEANSVLELGCGWGALSVFCAKHLGADVVSLDADDSVFPFLMAQAEHNNVTVKPWKHRYEQVTKADLSQFEIMVAADICFWDEMTQPLFNLCKRATQAGIRHIIIADPGRPPFWELAELAHEKLGADCREWHNESLDLSAHILDIEL